MPRAQKCWMVWSRENVTFWPTKRRAKADANWHMANGAAWAIITKTKTHRVLSDGSEVVRLFQTPRVVRFSQEVPEGEE